MFFACTAIFLCAVIFSCNGEGAIETSEVQLGANISLPCDFVYYNLSSPTTTYPFKKYWVLPNTTVVEDSFGTDGKFSVIELNVYNFSLFINGVEAQDFGTYECVMIWTNTAYESDVIRINLIEYNSDDDGSQDTSGMNILYGCIIGAGTVSVIMIMGCLLKKFCC